MGANVPKTPQVKLSIGGETFDAQARFKGDFATGTCGQRPGLTSQDLECKMYVVGEDGGAAGFWTVC
jgi:hypothetical protein